MKLVWTKQAIADLDRAYSYIAETDPDRSQDMIGRIEKAVQSLQQFPKMGRPGRVPQTRELVISRTPFILPYRVWQNRIEILAVLHGSRRWPDDFQATDRTE